MFVESLLSQFKTAINTAPLNAKENTERGFWKGCVEIREWKNGGDMKSGKRSLFGKPCLNMGAGLQFCRN